MTQRIALVTDSTCDIPAEWIEQYEISVVPLTIIFGSQAYLDGVELTAAQFYQRLSVETHHPTPSQPAPEAFLEAYRQAVGRGTEQIQAITISSAMSGTMESAQRAAQESGTPVTVMDGKNNSMGLGWQVMAAAPARGNGAGLEAMLAAAERVQREYAPEELFIAIVSPALGVHTGPRPIALCGYSER